MVVRGLPVIYRTWFYVVQLEVQDLCKCHTLRKILLSWVMCTRPKSTVTRSRKTPRRLTEPVKVPAPVEVSRSVTGRSRGKMESVVHGKCLRSLCDDGFDTHAAWRMAVGRRMEVSVSRMDDIVGIL